MRINEIINEAAVGTILTKNLEIVVDDHALERAQERGVHPPAVDYIIRKQLPKVIHKLEKIELGEKFWVYDWSTETSLGLRRISSTHLKFVLKTVYYGKASKTPGIEKVIQT